MRHFESHVRANVSRVVDPFLKPRHQSCYVYWGSKLGHAPSEVQSEFTCSSSNTFSALPSLKRLRVNSNPLTVNPHVFEFH